MKGLLIKDLLVLQKTLKTYVLFLCGYLVLTILGLFDLSVVSAMIQVILLMLPLSAFSYDEMSKWDYYAISLPIGRRAVVGSRYCFVLVLAALSLAYNLFCCLTVSLINRTAGVGILEAIGSMLVSAGVGILIVSVMLPLSYKLGAERARPYLYALIFLPMIAIFGLAKLGAFDQLDLSRLNLLPSSAAIGLLALVPVVALLVLGGSYLISCRIVAAKEF